jgi:hypothetical protein
MAGEGKKNREKGDRREHELIRGLELIGLAVTRSGGSLGAFDFIAENNGILLHVQVKSNRWAGPDERAAMAAVPTFLAENALKVVARIDDGVSEVKVQVTRRGEGWHPEYNIGVLFTNALQMARNETRAKRAARKSG